MSKMNTADATSIGEAELVTRALDGDEGAIRAIIRLHNRRLYRLARSVVRDNDEAEDVLQEAYLHAFAALPQFRGESRLATWLSRIVLNAALESARKKRPESMADIPSPAAAHNVIAFPGSLQGPIDPERAMAQREIREMIERAIDALPDGFRAVLMMRTVEGLSTEETSAALGLKAETVKTRLHRSRVLLRAALSEQIGSLFTDTFPFDGRRCERITERVIARLARAPAV